MPLFPSSRVAGEKQMRVDWGPLALLDLREESFPCGPFLERGCRGRQNPCADELGQRQHYHAVVCERVSYASVGFGKPSAA